MARAVVDTSAWSVLFRRSAPSRLNAREQFVADAVAGAIEAEEAVLLGVIRQELLQGLTPADRFRRIRDAMRPFPDEPALTMDYERAAEMFNTCRARGVQGSVVDFLVCATAERLRAPVLTLDGDFERYRDLLGIELYG